MTAAARPARRAIYTKPRQITVNYLRPGDEVAVWADYPDSLLPNWSDRLEDSVTWRAVHEIRVADPDEPNGERTVTWLDGGSREIHPDLFIVIRESVEIESERDRITDEVRRMADEIRDGRHADFTGGVFPDLIDSVVDRINALPA